MKIEVGRKRIMSVLSRNELLHKYEKEIREIDEINKNNKFKYIFELNRRLLWNVEEEFVARDKMADSLNIEFDFEDVLKNNIRMVGELGRKFERYKWLKRNLNDLWERIERVDEYNITNKKKLFGFLLSMLRRYGNCVISREDLPSYMKNNESNLPEVFASYAYDDKFFTILIFFEFYFQGIYLYFDWMHHDKLEGEMIKSELTEEMRNAEQLLFLRSDQTELKLPGRMIRGWCSWELGNFYSYCEEKGQVGSEKYIYNLYDNDIDQNLQLAGMRCYERVYNQRLEGRYIGTFNIKNRN